MVFKPRGSKIIQKKQIIVYTYASIVVKWFADKGVYS